MSAPLTGLVPALAAQAEGWAGATAYAKCAYARAPSGALVQAIDDHTSAAGPLTVAEFNLHWVAAYTAGRLPTQWGLNFNDEYQRGDLYVQGDVVHYRRGPGLGSDQQYLMICPAVLATGDFEAQLAAGDFVVLQNFTDAVVPGAALTVDPCPSASLVAAPPVEAVATSAQTRHAIMTMTVQVQDPVFNVTVPDENYDHEGDVDIDLLASQALFDAEELITVTLNGTHVKTSATWLSSTTFSLPGTFDVGDQVEVIAP